MMLSSRCKPGALDCFQQRPHSRPRLLHLVPGRGPATVRHPGRDRPEPERDLHRSCLRRRRPDPRDELRPNPRGLLPGRHPHLVRRQRLERRPAPLRREPERRDAHAHHARRTGSRRRLRRWRSRHGRLPFVEKGSGQRRSHRCGSPALAPAPLHRADPALGPAFPRAQLALGLVPFIECDQDIGALVGPEGAVPGVVGWLHAVSVAAATDGGCPRTCCDSKADAPDAGTGGEHSIGGSGSWQTLDSAGDRIGPELSPEVTSST